MCCSFLFPAEVDEFRQMIQRVQGSATEAAMLITTGHNKYIGTLYLKAFAPDGHSPNFSTTSRRTASGQQTGSNRLLSSLYSF